MEISFKQWLESYKNSGSFAYHVTPSTNLLGIAKEGLIINKKPNWGNHFGSHSQKGIFFTVSSKEIRFWMSQYENPVVLKIWYNPEEVISSDSHAPNSNTNFIIHQNIPIEDIEMWDGQSWVPVANMEYSQKYTPGKQKSGPYPGNTGNNQLKIQQTYKGKWMNQYPPEELDKIVKPGWTWEGSEESHRRREEDYKAFKKKHNMT